jgi:hypothetical protein
MKSSSNRINRIILTEGVPFNLVKNLEAEDRRASKLKIYPLP